MSNINLVVRCKTLYYSTENLSFQQEYNKFKILKKPRWQGVVYVINL